MRAFTLGLGLTPASFTSGTPTGVPVAQAPNPAFSGPATVGASQSTTNGGWTQFPTGFTYQHQQSNDGVTSWTDISGATSQTYTIGAGLSGKYIRPGVKASNGLGAAASFAHGAAVGPIAAALTITGSPTTTGTEAAAYTDTPGVTGGHQTGVTNGWALVGSLTGSGLTFDTATGALTATTLGPAGTYGPIHRTYTDADGLIATQAPFSIVVSASGGAGGELDFSDPNNSALAAGL